VRLDDSEQLVQVRLQDEGRAARGLGIGPKAMMPAEDDDGGTIGQRACGADDVNAGDVRQAEVEHNDVEPVAELTDGRRAVSCTRDGVALEPENLGERVAPVSIVLDDEHTRGHRGSVYTCDPTEGKRRFPGGIAHSRRPLVTEPQWLGGNDPEVVHDLLRQRARLLVPMQAAEMIHQHDEGRVIKARQEGDGTSA